MSMYRVTTTCILLEDYGFDDPEKWRLEPPSYK
jgi:hypothetical protein